jgi:drug/metabolite transporter (DMT)-like permease
VLLWPALALVVNACTWGLSWWPFRKLQALGVHPLWATVLIYAVTIVAITAWRPRAWRELRDAPTLWLLVLAAGTTNASFNWGVTVGDVVRVVLLFYLMPLWAVLLARLLLGEALTGNALLRVALALVGAAIVLWPADGGLPLPRTLAEGLGLIGGFTFALNNVMLRREAHRPEAARALAMFLGGSLIAGALALALSLQGTVPWPPTPAPGWIGGGLAMGAVFLAGNLDHRGAVRLGLGAGARRRPRDAGAGAGRRADRRRGAAGGTRLSLRRARRRVVPRPARRRGAATAGAVRSRPAACPDRHRNRPARHARGRVRRDAPRPSPPPR